MNPESNIPDTPPANNYPESFIKLSVADLSLQAAFTDTRRLPNPPYVFSGADQPPSGSTTKHTLFWARERSDTDLGSAGVLLLGNRLVGGGKDGRFYALDTTSLARVQDFLAFFGA